MDTFKIVAIENDATKPIQLAGADYAMYQTLQELIKAINQLTTVLNK